MPMYLLQATYSSYTWIYRVTQDPEDLKRPPDLASVFQAAGVKFLGFWYSFGDYDLTAILEVPNNVDMATLLIGLRAGWEGKAFDAVKATLLLTPDEAASATIAAAKALPSSRDASKEGPLQGYMDYKNADFSQESKQT